MAGLIKTDPITLTNAFSGHNVIPGDTLKLRAGTYSSNYINKIIGTSGSYVTVKAYDEDGAVERVIINGDFSDVSAKYITYIDIEFTTERNPNPTGTQSGLYHDFRGTGVKLINCTLHDSDNAGAWDNVDLVYGCIFYNHGYILDGVVNGHSLYTQNEDTLHKKIIKHSVFGRSANFGLHGYATNFSLTNFDVVENVLLPGSNHLIGSQKGDNGILFSNNHSCGIVTLGYGAHNHTALTCTGNRMYCPDNTPLGLNKWVSGNVSNNLIVAGDGSVNDPNNGIDVLNHTPPTGTNALAIDNNTYFNRNHKVKCFLDSTLSWLSLAEWMAAYGYDANSTLTNDGTSPVDSSHVYPNEYSDSSKRKGLVIIWNWSRASSVSVDLTSISINTGSIVNVLNCENPLSDILVTTMPANKILEFSMTGHTVAQVPGWTTRPTAFPVFGAFMLESM